MEIHVIDSVNSYLTILAKDTRRVWNSAMGTAAECTNCHVPPSVELNLTKAKFIQGRVNSQQPVSCIFVYIIRRLLDG